MIARAQSAGFDAIAAFEYEFFHFRETARALEERGHVRPEPITPGMFGYSLLRLNQNKDYVNALFEALGDRLRGTGSRVLVTSRHKLRALANPEHALWIPLGPLPMAEARLFFERSANSLLEDAAVQAHEDEARRVRTRVLRARHGRGENRRGGQLTSAP